MADSVKKYVDLAGLTEYDRLIKIKIAGDITKAVNDLDVADFALATDSNGVVTIKAIKEVDGKIVVSSDTTKDITLAKVATTGAAGDVSYSNTIDGTAVTNVDDALDALVTSTAGGVASKTVYITQTAGSSSDAYSKRYGIYQGSEGSTSSPDVNEKLVDIDIPKDMVVEDGSVVSIFFDSTDNTLHEGSISGTDVTAAIVGTSGTATAADAGKYIKLVIANSSGTPLYIKATDLVDIYTAAQGASEVQLAISNSNEISASVVAIAASKITHDATTVEAALDIIEGDATTVGSIAKAEADAKAYADTKVAALDTSADIALVAEDASGNVSFTQKINETDGIVGAVSGDKIVLTALSNTEIGNIVNPPTP